MTTNNDDTDNILKNQQNFNISDGNVKENDINVAQRNSQYLTELWKKGELEEGYYYLKDNGIFLDYYNGCNFNDTCDCEIKEVLAPVPSYKQWQQMKAFCEEFNAIDVAEENRKLKKLLNEIDVVYSSGINKRENKCDEYVIYQSTFTKLDELFYKWEKMREVLK